jgi:CheY-like chemotaxis protein
MKKVLILLNDNDPLMTRVCKNKFQKEGGWETKITRSYEEALRAVRTEKPQLVITDLLMPDESGHTGLDLIQTLRADNTLKDVVIVALSELTHDNEEEKALTAGATYFYAKSEVSIAQIIEKIKTLM